MILKDRHYKAIRCMVAGLSAVETARKVGVNPCTISEWRRDKVFFAELLKYRATIDKEEMERIARMEGLVNDTFIDLLLNGTRGIQLQCISLYYRMTQKVREEILIRLITKDPKEMSEEELKEEITEAEERISAKFDAMRQIIEASQTKNNHPDK